MSRKEPSFGQLATYMSDDKSERAFDLHQNLFSRDPDAVAAEFAQNARLLGKRVGGNYLYHEILSIDTRLCGQGQDVKEKLRLLALEFIANRCPRNMVYGALHRDHEGHLHYHLMISANERGDKKRLRLPKAVFEAAKRETERSARERYPELKQAEIMGASVEVKQERRETRQSRKAQEMKKRGARLSKTETLAQQIRAMLSYATSQAEFERLLKDQGFTFYERGKHCGIRPIPKEGETKARKAHRFATLGVEAEYAALVAREAEIGLEGEKEKEGLGARDADPEGDGAEAGNWPYVKYGSETDPKIEPSSEQNMEADQDPFLRELRSRRARQAKKDMERHRNKGPEGRGR